MSAQFRCFVACGLLGLGPTAQAVTATFDELSSPPLPDASKGLFFANGDSLAYSGVTWDDRFSVVGDQYRVDAVTPGPLFGIPHSGNYFVTSDGDGPLNDGLRITTDMLLTGAWFGRNAYYGFGAGADQVTIHALVGVQSMSAVVFDLPDTNPGNPAPLQFVDTSAFSGVVGITGYRIDRHALGDQNGNWVADDFTFVVASPVPEPAQALMLLAGIVLLAGASSGRRTRSRFGVPPR